MKVLQVTGAYAPARGVTGPPAAVHRLCQELIARGTAVSVVTTNNDGRCKVQMPANRWVQLDGVPVFYGNRWGSRGDWSPAMLRCISREAPTASLVHVTVIFSAALLCAAATCRRHGRPLIVSPRGGFASEAMAWHRGRKRVFMALGGRRSLGAADAFHATTAEEEQDCRALFPEKPVGRIPNGVDLPDDQKLAAWKRTATEEVVLFLGRLHPHKNLDVLIRAFAPVAARLPQATLVLAGPDQGGIEKPLRGLAHSLGLATRVRFVGHREGDEKAALLAQARVLVLPSKSENFGNVVAEALAHGTPVITSRGTPWSEAPARGCGWWVEAEPAIMAAAIEEALRSGPEQLAAMGAAGRRWMQQSFAWPAVAERMRQFYHEVAMAAPCGRRRQPTLP